jgi:glucokinase
MGLTIGVDVGGTKVAAGVVDEQGHIVARSREATPATSADAAVSVIVDLVKELAAEHTVERVGLGVAGLIDETRSVVRFAPNLRWQREPLREQVEQATGLLVTVENDGNTAGWGEYRFGAAQGIDDFVMITVGTGVGGALVIHGQLYRGAFGVAAEVGHLVLDPDGPACGCGRHGCWEQYASGSALLRLARASAADDRGRASLLLGFGDGTPEGIEGEHITRAAQAGDPVAVDAFERTGRWLGRGLAELAAILDPACFVIGGGVADAGDLLLGPAAREFADHLVAQDVRPHARIVPASLGNTAGLVGAAELARTP